LNICRNRDRKSGKEEIDVAVKQKWLVDRRRKVLKD
jgi:hypothetical protein